MPRKTQSERDREHYNQSSQRWRVFMEQLDAVNTPAEAKALVRQAPREGTPGRKFYSNLGFFMLEFVIPSEASPDERQLYRDLMRRMASAGHVSPGVLAEFERNNP